MEQKSKALPIILIILLVLVLCCIVISVGLIAGGVWLNDKVNTSGGYNFPAETVTITEVTPETTTNEPVPDEAIETLDTLEQTIVPINDPVELAERLGGKLNVPDTLIDPDALIQWVPENLLGRQYGHQRELPDHGGAPICW